MSSDVARGSPRLFVFGTLCDADVRRIVLGSDRAHARPASLDGFRAVTLAGETYPVLAPARKHRLAGMLLDLDAGELDRVAFYEGEEYVFRDVTVWDGPGVAVEALVCAERVALPVRPTAARTPWSLEAWQLRYKQAFLPRTQRYMSMYGRMSAAEADRVWQSWPAGD